ncbi:hypothetical protein VKT23_018548 [Stygiomarasmius scandens]|uniref:Uncharacterized protein n=1 Tax=Marasmiellus scandens TaxID=2682957 RepID=A0ABR1INW3_9AGAR
MPDAGQKRKPGRPPQALLYEREENPHLFTGKWNDTRDYENGLIVLLLGDAQVTCKDIVVTDEAYFLFMKSRHPILSRCPVPAPESWVFEPGEVVYSVQSDREKEGTIKSVDAQHCLVEFEDSADEYIATRNLRKKFRSVDTVEVTYGPKKGEHGVIVAVWWDTCEVACLQEKVVTEHIIVHLNHCKRDSPRDGGGIPWINEHITVCWGQYWGYTGIVKDAFPPIAPRYLTTLEIWIPKLASSVKFNHDDVFQTISHRMLKDAVLLTPWQQHFKQASWDDKALSNIVVDPLTGIRVEVKTLPMQTPREPWLNKSMKVIRGPMKDYIGKVVGVNRVYSNPKFKSGLRITVQFDQVMLFSRGTAARGDWDYNWLLDCETGMHLNQAYPLRGYQKFYEPDVGYIQISPTAISTLRQDEPVARTPPPSPSQIVHDGGAWDPSSMTPFSSLASSSSHWTMHPNLDGKTFLAAYRSSVGEIQNRVHVTPNRAAGRVVITWQQKKPISVLPDHIVDITGKDVIKPTSHQGGILAVRGPHVGKYMRRIYMKYDDDEHWKDPWMTCMVFNNLDSNNQHIIEDYILVDAKDCAPCEERKPFGALAEHVKQVRELARKKVQRPRPDPAINKNKRTK